MPPVVEMQGITKRFGPVAANDGIDLAIEAGEVHALLGENGAGKSTLMKILFGLYQPDAGTIRVDGRAVRLRGPADAISLGIGMVTQHFALVPTLTVTENIALTALRGFRFDYARARAEVMATAERYGIAVDPDARVGDLSVGEQQRVEILKALYRRCRVLILDEPTAVLTPQEAARLFRELRGLVERGLAVVFISHKLEEVLEASQRITVLRDGRVVGRFRAGEVTAAELARCMVGRDVERPARAAASAAPGAPVLEVEDLHVTDGRGLPAVRGVSLVVREREIVGIAGVSGNGQSELVEVLCGVRMPAAGRVRVAGRDLAGLGPRGVVRLGVGRIPEDRLRGVVGDLSVAENLALESLDDFTRRGGVLDRRAMLAHAQRLIAEYQVKAGPATRAGTLSGGNMQKVILARALSRRPVLVVAAQPTRGLDVGATAFVHRQLLAQRDRGAAVLLVSEDLEEILALADRVAVMYRGRIVGEVPAATADRSELGLLMAGAGGGSR